MMANKCLTRVSDGGNYWERQRMVADLEFYASASNVAE